MRKTIYILLITILSLSFVACSGNSTNSADSGTSNVVAPIANAGNDQSQLVSSLVTLDASESTGSALTYSWSVDSAPTTVTLSDVNISNPTFTPTDAGTYVFTLLVRDESGKTSSDIVSIEVTNTALPLSANAGMDQSYIVSTLVTLDASASSGSSLTYTWSVSGPESVVLSNVVKPTFTPMAVGIYTCTVIVTDSESVTKTDTVIITVTNAPIPLQANAGPDQSKQVNSSVILDASASTGSGLTYSWSVSGPESVTLSNVVKPIFTPTTPGTYTCTLTAMDSIGTTKTDTVIITITPIPLQANAGSDQSVQVNTTVVLDASSSLGNISSYFWTVNSVPTSGTITLSDETVSQPTFLPTVGGTYTLTVEVTDTNGTTSSDSVNITVTSVTTPMTLLANAGIDQSVQVNSSVVLDASASTGSGLTYSWSVSGPESVTLSNVEQPTFTPTIAGTYTCTVVVTDNTNATASDSTIVTVSPLPLQANAGATQTVASSATATLDGNSSTGSSINYSWNVISAPAGSGYYFSTATNIVNPVFVPVSGGLYTIELTVTDTNGATDTSTVDITALAVPTATITLNRATNQTNVIIVGDTINLEGNTSIGNGLTYLWEVIGYPSSAPTIANNTSVVPSFSASEIGTYTIRLTVTDVLGQSHITTKIIDVLEIYVTPGSSYPYIHIGDTLQLSVSEARVDPSASVTVYWSATGVPASTDTSTVNTRIADQSSLNTTLIPLYLGSYDVRLYYMTPTKTVVHTISATVLADPIANAGADLNVQVNQQVILNNGVNGSTGTSLTYAWTCSNPNVTINQADTVSPTFSATAVGAYTVILTVTDHSSAPSKTATDTVVVQVTL